MIKYLRLRKKFYFLDPYNLQAKYILNNTSDKEIIVLIFAKENPITLKSISSHFVSGTESRCILKSSMLSKFPTEDVQLELYSTTPLSTKLWKKAIKKLVKNRKKIE